MLKFHFASSAIFYICIYCHTIQTSISLYKRYIIRFLTDKSEKNITRYTFSYFIPFIFIFLIPIFFNKAMNKGNSCQGLLTIASVNWCRVWVSLIDVFFLSILQHPLARITCRWNASLSHGAKSICKKE